MLLLSLAALLQPVSVAPGQTGAAACELHVWPTSSFMAASHGPTLGSILGGNPGGEARPRHDVRQMLANIASDDFQRAAIEELHLGNSGRFSGYRVIVHPVPADSSYSDAWFSGGRNMGAGDRRSASAASCYAELHIVIISYLRATGGRGVNTIFLYREFGSSGPATGWAADATSNGAPAFPPRSPEQDAQATVDLRAAIQQNLRDFLGSRAMQPTRLRRPR